MMMRMAMAVGICCGGFRRIHCCSQRPFLRAAVAAARVGHYSSSDDDDLGIVEKFPIDSSSLPERWKDEISPADVKVLTKFQSRYNLVQVVEISRRADSDLAGARVLMLDKPGNIHSIYFQLKALTGSYYDAFASLPPLLEDDGPIGILGLGAGTAARVVHHFWPCVELHGWELDMAVVAVARRYFDMLELERGEASTLPREEQQQGYGEASKLGKNGRLIVHVGDGLGASIEKGFAGILVDLFFKGKVLPALQDPQVWESMKKKLRSGGRIMVNCGGSCVESEDGKDGKDAMEETLGALMEAFHGEVSKKGYYPNDNLMALTGPFPDVFQWKKSLPSCLRDGVSDWRPTC